MSVLDQHLFYRYEETFEPSMTIGTLRQLITCNFFDAEEFLVLPRQEDRDLVIGHHIIQGIPQVIQIVEKIPTRYDERLFSPTS